jgi:hypothetical protein
MDRDLQVSPHTIFIWSGNPSDDISSNSGRSLYKRSLRYPAIGRELIHQKRYPLNTPDVSLGDNSLYGDSRTRHLSVPREQGVSPSQVRTHTLPPKNAWSRRFGPRLYLGEGIKTSTSLEVSTAELIYYAQHRTESKLQRLPKIISKLGV